MKYAGYSKFAIACLGAFASLSFSDISSAGVIQSFVNTTTSSRADSMRGWEFVTNSSFDVSALGVYDFGSDGLFDSHEVGLWESSGALIASVVVPDGTGSTLGSVAGSPDGGFRYVDLGTNITLSAGTNYIIAAYFPTGDDYTTLNAGGDPNPSSSGGFGSAGNPAPVFDSRIAFVNNRYVNGSGAVGFVYPNQTFGQYMLDADFVIAESGVGEGAGSVPAPTGLALLGIGGVALFGFGSRRNSSAAV